MMNETNRDEVLWRYLGGNPPSPELAAEIASDAGLARRLAELALLECCLNDLADAGQETPATQPVVSLRLKRSELTSREATTSDSNAKVAATIYCETPDLVRARYSRYVWGALAACLLGLIGGAIWSLSSKMEPFQVRFEARGENVTVRRGAETVPVTDSWLLRAGDVIRTGGESKATLQFENEATALTLSKDAELALIPTPGGKRLELTRGHLEAEVDKQPAGAPLVCVTPHVTITVLGTRFFVATDAETTRVVVKEGRVQVKERDSQAVADVVAGQIAFAVPQAPPAVKSFETVQRPSLPDGWLAYDVGSVGLPGSAVFDPIDGTMLLKGSGSIIAFESDNFHFLYQRWRGDADLVVRLVSLAETDPNAKAGIMIREDLSPGARDVMINFEPQRGRGAVDFRQRPVADGKSSVRITPNTPLPIWLRLVRRGDLFAGYFSLDGQTWQQAGKTVSLPLAEQVYVGFAVASHDNTVTTAALLENFSLRLPTTREPTD